MHSSGIVKHCVLIHINYVNYNTSQPIIQHLLLLFSEKYFKHYVKSAAGVCLTRIMNIDNNYYKQLCPQVSRYLLGVIVRL